MDGRDYKQFARLAALLLALADLAERAGRACLPVRCLVLWILRRAETVALAHAVEAARAPFPRAEFPCADASSDESDRLAWSFRALAAVFRALAHWARLAQKSAGVPRCLALPLPHAGAARSRTVAEFPPRPLDTS